jgi:hypothetical protein
MRNYWLKLWFREAEDKSETESEHTGKDFEMIEKDDEQ